MYDATTCPLDCYDACRIILDRNGKLKGDTSHPLTQGYLCPNLNHYDGFQRILSPSYREKMISMDDALERLFHIIEGTYMDKLLFYRGSGNLGVMQRSMDHFFASLGAVGTRGSLCDGAGEAGVLMGRGASYPLSASMIEEADTIIVWGRNPEITHTHILPLLKKKKLVVIDPVKTALAKSADIHVQIKPACDVHLAVILSRLLIESGLADNDFLEKRVNGYGEFCDWIKQISPQETLVNIGVSLSLIEAIIELIRGKKCIILVGVGVQKYRNGAEVLRAIDAVGAILGLFGKEGCGVSYLGTSLQGVNVPFEQFTKTVPMPTVDFSGFDTVFIQGGNPLAQLPDSLVMEKRFKKVREKIYFGTYENETSSQCDLIIPAKSFLEKSDIRASYGDYTLQRMNPVRQQSDIGISEYALAERLCGHFSVVIPSEDELLMHLYNQIEITDGVEYKKNRPLIPYQEGFLTDSKKFEFMQRADLTFKGEEGFFLLSSKSLRSLNSQFNRPKGIHLHNECGFEPGEEVNVTSSNGSIRLKVVHDERLRPDCALIYAGTLGVNVLTPGIMSNEGESAVFQENKVRIEKC